jgi:hypothetical protein
LLRGTALAALAMLQACREFSGPRWHGRKSGRIVRAHPRIVAGLGQAALLETHGIGGVTDLDWWRWTAAGPLSIWGVPARHDCRRGACDINARLWLGFVVAARMLRAQVTVPIHFGTFAQGRRRELYQLTSGGRLMKMASTLPPLLRPKSVPRS